MNKIASDILDVELKVKAAAKKNKQMMTDVSVLMWVITVSCDK